MARSGESVEVRDRLALDGKKPAATSTSRLSNRCRGKNGPLGYLRLTLDTHTPATEAKQVDNTTNILRLMLLLSLGYRRGADPHAAAGQTHPLAAIALPAHRQQAG